jgi:hypothetical protein
MNDTVKTISWRELNLNITLYGNKMLVRLHSNIAGIGLSGYHALVWSQIVITRDSDVETIGKKVKLSLCLINHHTIKVYEWMSEWWLYSFMHF